MSVSTSHREKADPRKGLTLSGGTDRLLDVLDLSMRDSSGVCVCLKPVVCQGMDS